MSLANDRWDTRPYWQRCLDVLSQLANVIFLNGMPDESISGRAWRGHKAGKTRWKIVRGLAEALYWFKDKGTHCQQAFEQDLARSRLRAEYVAKLIAAKA